MFEFFHFAGQSNLIIGVGLWLEKSHLYRQVQGSNFGIDNRDWKWCGEGWKVINKKKKKRDQSKLRDTKHG